MLQHFALVLNCRCVAVARRLPALHVQEWYAGRQHTRCTSCLGRSARRSIWYQRTHCGFRRAALLGSILCCAVRALSTALTHSLTHVRSVQPVGALETAGPMIGLHCVVCRLHADRISAHCWLLHLADAHCKLAHRFGLHGVSGMGAEFCSPLLFCHVFAERDGQGRSLRFYGVLRFRRTLAWRSRCAIMA